jgi:hypothetical protein
MVIHTRFKHTTTTIHHITIIPTKPGIVIPVVPTPPLLLPPPLPSLLPSTSITGKPTGILVAVVVLLQSWYMIIPAASPSSEVGAGQAREDAGEGVEGGVDRRGEDVRRGGEEGEEGVAEGLEGVVKL